MNRLAVSHAAALVELFERISVDPAAARFHPHPFMAADARMIADWPGRDIYLGLFVDGSIQGYGMLRGWDQGYEVPSLGIYLTPEVRGRGLAHVFMQALHDTARNAGARQVRLKVYPDNTPALELYKSMGYRFNNTDNGQLVGCVALKP